MQQIKDDVDEHNRPVNNTLDIIAELVETGADVLSSAELNKLQADGKQLKSRYDNVSNNSDRLLKRMVGALEELSKFRGEVSAFRNWMEKALLDHLHKPWHHTSTALVYSQGHFF